jgi:drug/metabolite transporter (DMT)-like permease
VSRRDLTLLVCLSAIWGASFLFIKLGVDQLEPSAVVLGRLVVGVLVLVPLLPARGGLRSRSERSTTPSRSGCSALPRPGSTRG